MESNDMSEPWMLMSAGRDAGVAGSMARSPVAGPQPDPRPVLSTAAMASLLDEIDTGVLVCDAHGQVLLANEAARRELAAGGVLALAPDGALDVQGGVGVLPLRRAVHNAAVDRRHQMLPLRAADRALMVSVQPLRGETSLAVLLLGRRRIGADLALQELGRLFDLTPAELEVLGGMLAGVRVSALARARGVALSTVRTQIGALRLKLGVHRADDLTRLVAELPPMIGALRTPLAALVRAASDHFRRRTGTACQ
jgi:DNA-binding CsgD family transcriptional regulator